MVFKTGDGFESTSDIGLGCMGITAFYGAPMSQPDATALLKATYDAGYRHFDTAEIYKTGSIMKDGDDDTYNEAVIGPFLKDLSRDSFTVASKFMPAKWDNKCDYATVKTALTNTLQRLGLEYVDLYYCHRMPPTIEGCLEFMASCKRLIQDGLILHVGLSEVSGPWLDQAHKVHPVACIQQEWSLMSRSPEAALIPTCAKLGVGIVAYSPLSRNLLAGPLEEKPTDWRGSLPRYSEENLAKNIELVKEIEALGKSKDATAAQLSLAWLIHKAKQLGVQVLPIPGTTKSSHAESNLAASRIALSEADMALLEEIASKHAGERGGPEYMAASFEVHE